ncbi:MAG: bifunctional 2-polyprenyl-6-hydroxyphenol methylase/3-demethylubiquinol 3-O-methyltransferase UbiG, partial [Gammaproteobacteria bacterium]|nr:bifunctional 2-polyprenyl-6-hydroxyphenol methylase/3-demethylubiquinol 3-O-methyltransferase UbiG [Gammaproteobacteria bacterium]
MSENTARNIDPKEIAKFDEVAYRWWDAESEFKPLHEINPLRLDYINRHGQIKGKAVVDVGCGGGILSESMARTGAKVTGIDMGPGPIEIAKLHLLESGLEVDYQQIAAEEFAANNPEKYDVVTCMEMLEHVPDPESIIKACTDMIKPGGYAFFSTLNRNPKSYVHAILGAEYILNMLTKGTHDYQKFIKPSELARWMRGAGLEVKNITGLTYNPLSKNYKL